MEFRFDAIIYSNLSNENSDAGQTKCFRRPQVPHTWFKPMVGELRVADIFCVALLDE